MMHVDDFIEDASQNEYARAWFELFRRPAIVKMQEPNDKKLFATYQGKRFRVTGCSRFGDVWLHSNFDEDTTYEHRVDVMACSEWSDHA